MAVKTKKKKKKKKKKKFGTVRVQRPVPFDDDQVVEMKRTILKTGNFWVTDLSFKRFICDLSRDGRIREEIFIFTENG